MPCENPFKRLSVKHTLITFVLLAEQLRRRFAKPFSRVRLPDWTLFSGHKC
jgi:hypothetical protein